MTSTTSYTSMPRFFLLLLLLAGPGAVWAQPETPSVLHLSLQDALDQATHHNFSARQAEADWHVARAEAHKARAVFLPQLSISELGTATNDPLNAFGFKLKQEIVTQADFDPAVLNDPESLSHFSTRFEIRQPILNADGLFEYQAAQQVAQAAQQGWHRSQHYVGYQVKHAYYGLVLARRSLGVLDSALVVARTNRDQAQNFFDQGLITRADLLEADVRLLDLESKRTSASVGIRNASDQIRYVLGLDQAVDIIPTDAFEPLTFENNPVDYAQVNARRSDMRALQHQAEAARQMVKASRLKFLPRLNAFGAYELNDDTPFGGHGTNWGIGATLQWNLFSGFKQIGGVERTRAEWRKARLAYDDQALKNQVEIEAARRSIEETQQQLDLAQAAITQARENLRIRQDRYAQGLEKTTDVLNAEIALANQRLNALQTLYRYYVSLFQLELLLEQPLFPNS